MNKKIEIDLNNLIRIVYNKIALWVNEDLEAEQKSRNLKFVSHEIIQTILNEVFSKVDGVTTEVKTEKQLPIIENNKKNGIFKSFLKKKIFIKKI
jgi:translation initiation factor IF-2